MSEKKKSVLKNIFVLIFLTITFFGTLISFFIHRDVKRDLHRDLSHTSAVIKSYYELTFKQWELTLLSVGIRLSEFSVDNKDESRLNFANEALKNYDLLLAFGYADTTGQVQTFTGFSLTDSLPHLMKSENSRRSFALAKKRKNLVIGEAYFFPAVNDWIIPIRVPIRNKKGELVAINTSAINYRALIRELTSFQINPNYRVHLINDDFHITQLYFPLDSIRYSDVIRQSSEIYQSIKDIAIDEHSVFFESINTIESQSNFGISVPLTNLNHTLIISVSKAVLWNNFMTNFRVVLISYVLLCIGLILLYRHFEKKQQEYLYSLETERANLKAIFESTNNIIGLFDEHQRVIEFNSAFEQYSKIDGITLKKGQDVLSELKDVEIANQFKTFQKRALAGEKFKEIVEYPTSRGIYHFKFSYNPIYKGDKITGVSMFVDDITELTKSQKKLEEYNLKLEEMVKSRTQEIADKNRDLEMAVESLKETQVQMVQIEKMASLGILVAGIGHEINNPLNFIKNGLDTLIKVLNDSHPDAIEKIKPFRNIINEGVNRASNIVKSLSHFSRGGASMEEECHIHNILDNCLVILQSHLKTHVTVNKNYSDKTIVCLGNDGRLHQAFLNILTNAEQAIPGNGTIDITTELVGKKIKIRIKDSGTGIDKAHLKKITDPFFTTKPPGKGTGLGMFITQSIIQEHHGHLDVKSEVGKGTEFIITL